MLKGMAIATVKSWATALIGLACGAALATRGDPGAIMLPPIVALVQAIKTSDRPMPAFAVKLAICYAMLVVGYVTTKLL